MAEDMLNRMRQKHQSTKCKQNPCQCQNKINLSIVQASHSVIQANGSIDLQYHCPSGSFNDLKLNLFFGYQQLSIIKWWIWLVLLICFILAKFCLLVTKALSIILLCLRICIVCCSTKNFQSPFLQRISWFDPVSLFEQDLFILPVLDWNWFPMRLTQVVFSNAKDTYLCLMIFDHMSLHCKLVLAQYRKYKYCLGIPSCKNLTFEPAPLPLEYVIPLLEVDIFLKSLKVYKQINYGDYSSSIIE